MADDLKLRRILRQQVFRKAEEERRRLKLEEIAASPPNERSASSPPTETLGKNVLTGRGTLTEHARLNADATITANIEKTTHPKAVGFLCMKTSPSSSVSMSQQSPSPLTKVRVSNPNNNAATQKPVVHRKTKSLLDSDDSSDDEDILAHARRLESQKREQAGNALDPSAEKPVQASGTTSKLHPPRSGSTAHRRLLDESDSDDLLSHAQSREQEQSVEKVEQVGASETTSSVLQTRVPSSKESTTVARNPLILLREQNARDVQNLQPQKLYSDTAEQRLWSDSEEELALAPEKPKRGRKKKEVDIPQQKQAPGGGATNVKKRRASPLSEHGESKAPRSFSPAAHSRTADETEIDIAALKPEFEAPRFGPFAVETPFILGGEESGEKYEVPFSIARYLLPYQREGIEFMYRSAIQPRKGAILGDGMY
jgi:hypothetical protein